MGRKMILQQGILKEFRLREVLNQLNKFNVNIAALIRTKIKRCGFKNTTDFMLIFNGVYKKKETDIVWSYYSNAKLKTHLIAWEKNH